MCEEKKSFYLCEHPIGGGLPHSGTRLSGAVSWCSIKTAGSCVQVGKIDIIGPNGNMLLR